MRGPYKERGQRGGNRASLDIRAVILCSGTDPDSRTGLECHRFGEAVLGAVAAWRHRERRRREGVQERVR